MDEEKTTQETPKPEKKLSRTTLTFYVVGLFSVALALILISYVAQTRADKQLESLNTQLSEQQTVAQGATQKMEDLQKQYDQLSTALDKVRGTLGSELAKTDVAGAAEQRMDELAVYQLLTRIDTLLLEDDIDGAQKAYDELTAAYDEAQLSGTAKENSFDSDINKLFESTKNSLQQKQEEALQKPSADEAENN